MSEGCMSHQSDWGYYKQAIKLPLVKVNHVCEDFSQILERLSLFRYKQYQIGLISTFPMLRLLWLRPELCQE